MSGVAVDPEPLPLSVVDPLVLPVVELAMAEPFSLALVSRASLAEPSTWMPNETEPPAGMLPVQLSLVKV